MRGGCNTRICGVLHANVSVWIAAWRGRKKGERGNESIVKGICVTEASDNVHFRAHHITLNLAADWRRGKGDRNRSAASVPTWEIPYSDEWIGGQVLLLTHLKKIWGNFHFSSPHSLIKLIPPLPASSVRRKGIGLSLNDPTMARGESRTEWEVHNEGKKRSKIDRHVVFVRLFCRSVELWSPPHGNRLFWRTRDACVSVRGIQSFYTTHTEEGLMLLPALSMMTVFFFFRIIMQCKQLMFEGNMMRERDWGRMELK